MRPPKIDTNNIFVFVFILLFSFVFLVIKFYQIALEEAYSYHQQLQTEMAKSATTSIELYFQRLGDDLQLMSDLELKAVEKFIASGNRSQQGIAAWFVVGEGGSIESLWSYTKQDSLLFRSVLPELLEDVRSVHSHDPAGLHFSSVMPLDADPETSPYVFLAIYRPEGPEAEASIGLVLSFDWMMQRFVSPLKLGQDDFAWVMDSQGNLIYHPRHKEMLMHNIGELQEDCADCHDSFTIQQRMIRERQGKAEYLITGEPKKIMAYEPISYGDVEWVLAISTHTPAVVRDVLRRSISIFILSAIFLLLLIIAGLVLFYLNLKRIKAEEAQKSLAQIQRIQEKLDQVSQLASLGELIDSVAHEINTPAGIISAIADGLLLDDALEPEGRTELGTIKNQVQRIRSYTKRLLGYSRVMPFDPALYDMRDLLEECLFLLGPRLREKQVNIQKFLPEGKTECLFDRPRLEQVIINLLNNAIDFVSQGGNIKIRLECSRDDPEVPGQYWDVLSVEDDGVGISPADLPHIFEPFFSKRPSMNGNGLGLSISKSIVERHAGHLVVKSAKGEGATFSIYLPVEEA